MGIPLFTYISRDFIFPFFIGDFVNKPTKCHICHNLYWPQLWNLSAISKEKLIVFSGKLNKAKGLEKQRTTPKSDVEAARKKRALEQKAIKAKAATKTPKIAGTKSPNFFIAGEKT